MTLYIGKSKTEILRSALQKVENTTSLTSVGPGSVLRSIVESITTEIGDMFNIMDFNISQSSLSTAQGRSLDLIGGLYGVNRKTISSARETESLSGRFLFYISSPVAEDINIPKGTKVYTSAGDYIGEQFIYETTSNTLIVTGQTYAYASIRPAFADAIYTAGAESLTSHSYVSPQGYLIQCTNPKPIPPTVGYESDEEYRTRIVKNIRVNSTGTVEAVRFKALSFEGVKDARIQSQKFGMGTFNLLIVPEVPIQGQVLIRRIAPEIQKVAPVGSTMYLVLPESQPFTVKVNITIGENMSSVAKESIRARVKTIIERYVDSLLPGGTVVYNRMVSLIYGASNSILDVQVNSFSVNGTEVSRNNFTPKENQQLVPSNITVTTSI